MLKSFMLSTTVVAFAFAAHAQTPLSAYANENGYILEKS
jgi:hypothetical protein